MIYNIEYIERLQKGASVMPIVRETIGILRKTGYPDAIFQHWGIILNDSNREMAKKDLEKILAQLPILEQNILNLRYKKFFTIREIAIKLKNPCHIIRKRKEEVLRKIMYTKEGMELYQSYRQKGDEDFRSANHLEKT